MDSSLLYQSNLIVGIFQASITHSLQTSKKSLHCLSLSKHGLIHLTQLKHSTISYLVVIFFPFLCFVSNFQRPLSICLIFTTVLPYTYLFLESKKKEVTVYMYILPPYNGWFCLSKTLNAFNFRKYRCMLQKITLALECVCYRFIFHTNNVNHFKNI